ncbi:MAG: hypothetical protein IIX01_02325 [Clostridia bacterium]|nr:hypothetical protein [Clostridia bacterium]
MSEKNERENEQTEKNTKKQNDVVTAESIGAVGALFSLFALLILFTGTLIFGDLGAAVKSFLLGSCGWFSYLLLPIVFLSFGAKFIGKRFFTKKPVLWTVIALALGFCLAQAIDTWSWENQGYLSKCFKIGSLGAVSSSPAGWVGGLAVFALRKLFGKTVSVVLLSVLVVVSALIAFRFVTGYSLVKGFLKALKPTKKEKGVEQASVSQSSEQGYDGYANGNGNQRRVNDPNGYQNGYQNGYPNSEAAYSSMGQIRPEYVPVSPQFDQRPGVTLADDYSSAQSGYAQNNPQSSAFSPFGYPMQGGQSTNASQQAQQQSLGREFLFSGDPAENFKRNLIFDETARVNQKPAADPYQPSFGGNGSPFQPTASYTNAYENAVNETREPVRPEKIVTDNTPFIEEYPAERYAVREEYIHTPTNYPIQPQAEEIPLRSDFDSPIAREERNSFPEQPSWERESRVERGGYLNEERSDFVRTERESVIEPVDSTPTPMPSSSRSEPDFRSIFSPANPNLFGGGNEEPSLDLRNSFDRSAERKLVEDDDDLFGENQTDREQRVDFTQRETSFGFGFSERNEPNETVEPIQGEERELRGANIFDDEPQGAEDAPAFEERGRGVERSGIDLFETRGVDRGRNAEIPPVERKEIVREEKPVPIAPVEKPKPKIIRPYKTAPMDFFDCSDIEPSANGEETEVNKRTILDTLEGFKVTDATIASVTYGPTVTRYNVAIPRNISPKKVVSLDQEIAISLYAAKGVNIYPNFEDGAVSIEVPNKRRQFVQLGCMLKDDGFTKSKPTSLTFAMGKDVGNRKIYGDIRKMTHLLVAGASGSGKSVFLRCLIISLIVKYSPQDLRLILIDPKKTEFVIYDHLPHLVINEIITETNKVIQSLNWAIGEMNRR